MFRKTLLITSLGLALTACQSAPDSGPTGPKQLATQADLSAIVGKTVSFQQGQSFRILANGTIQGSWDGTPVVGTYVMRDGFFCRTLTSGPRGPTGEDCQLFVLDGNTLAVTRDRGTGASFNYTIS